MGVSSGLTESGGAYVLGAAGLAGAAVPASGIAVIDELGAAAKSRQHCSRSAVFAVRATFRRILAIHAGRKDGMLGDLASLLRLAF